jgi:hypothetical protein
MLMIVMSLAISLVPIQSFYSLSQSGSTSNQAFQNERFQQEKKDTNYPIVLDLPSSVRLEPISLPSGDNAWAVQIVSRGGIDGKGRGDVTLTSDGNLTWNGPDGSCNRTLPGETMSALTKVVLAVEAPAYLTGIPAASVCGDCYVTGMIIQQRSVSGAVRVSSGIWDDFRQAKVTAGMITVYEALMAQKGCKLQ